MSGQTTAAKYEQQEWGKNCVMFALSKVLSVSTNSLARYIVDHNTGGVTMIKQMENGSVVKRVLVDLGFVSLMEGGAKWSRMKLLVGSYGLDTDNNGKLVETMYFDNNGNKKYTHETKAKFYGVYWRHKGKEDWTDKDVQPGMSDHAFTIYIAGTTISIPPTNDSTFDASHSPPKDDDFISVFRPTRTIAM
jgi:hypothetical protein